MSGICSAHQHYEMGCRLCEYMPPTEEEKLEIVKGDTTPVPGVHFDLFEERDPLCPHCGKPSMMVLYATNFHEHTCENQHVWRIY